MKKRTINIYVVTALAFVVGGLIGYRLNKTIAGQQEPMEVWGTYSNSTSVFSIGIPSGSDVGQKRESSVNGRLGGVIIEEGSDDNTPTVTVSSYTTRENLEKDFKDSRAASFDDGMELNGLAKTMVTLNGSTANIYAGVHAIDGVGGSEYDYIGVEVIGKTYSHMIQMYNMGVDPNDERVQQYLSSFKAD